MAAFDYTGLQNTAYNLIERFGQSVTVTRKNTTENPVTGVPTVVAATSEVFKAINPPASKGTIEAFDNRLIGMAAEIGKSVRFFILAAKNSSLVPAGNDLFTDTDGNTFSILGCTTIAPAGSASKICYKIGVAV
jgi:hypothetical protein